MKDLFYRLYMFIVFFIIYVGMNIGVFGIVVVYFNFYIELIFGFIDCEKR